nr:hypothetical protein [Burkholderia sp. MBR-1]
MGIALNAERPVENAENTCGEFFRNCIDAPATEDHCKLIAASPSEKSSVADLLREAASDTAQDVVTDVIAMAIIDELELIKIKTEYPKLISPISGRCYA